MKKRGLHLISILILTITFLGTCTPSKKPAFPIKKVANVEVRFSYADVNFIEAVVASNHAEIEMARLAIERTLSTKVRVLAYKFEKDHVMELVALREIANKHGVTISTAYEDPAGILRDQDFSDFDNQWCKELLTRHEQAIQQFEMMIETTDDEELKDWIRQSIQGLKIHLEELVEYQDKLYTSDLRN